MGFLNQAQKGNEEIPGLGGGVGMMLFEGKRYHISAIAKISPPTPLRKMPSALSVPGQSAMGNVKHHQEDGAMIWFA